MNEINPSTASTTIDKSLVKVVNGRMVFADQNALDQVREKLGKLSISVDGTKALADWEKSLNFASLRASANKEMFNLEALQTAGKPTYAFDLVNEFGFPDFLASIVNNDGEYQVGERIFWFHNKIKYQADSEAELLLIKQNPLSAKKQLYAGTSIIAPSRNIGNSTLKGQVTVNTVTQGIDPYAANGFVSYFNLYNDPNSRRRIIYDLHVSVQDDGISYSRHYYSTVLYLQIKYEYYSFGRNAWYPAVGQNFNWQTDITMQCTPSVPNQISITRLTDGSLTSSGTLTSSGSYDNGIKVIPLSHYSLVSDVSSQGTSKSDVIWSISGSGNLNGYPADDPAHAFLVSYNPLW